MLTLLSALVAGLLGTAAACSCLPPGDDFKCGRGDQYVLLGVGRSNANIGCLFQNDGTEDPRIISVQEGVTLARFEVTTVLRQPEGGALEDGDTVNIRSSAASNLCGYQVQPDVEYVLFASERGPEDCEAVPDNIPIAITNTGTRSLKDLRFLDTGLNLGTSLCAGNIQEPEDDILADIAADCNLAMDDERTCEKDCQEFCDRRCTRKCGLGDFTGTDLCAQDCDGSCNRRCNRQCEEAPL